MKFRLERIFGQVSIALSALLLICFALHSWYGPDIWHHLDRGRKIVESGSINPPQSQLIPQVSPAAPAWLFQYSLFRAYEFGGVSLVSAGFVILWIMIGYLWIKVARIRTYPTLGGVILLGVVFCIHLRMEHRPEVLSYFFILLYIWILNGRTHLRPRHIVILFVSMIIWVNSHGYFIFGLGVLGAKFLSSLIEHKGSERGESKLLAITVVVCVLATLVRPDFTGAWEMVLHYNRLLGSVKLELEEFIPTYRFYPLFPLPIYWSLVLSGSVFALISLIRRKHVFASLLALGTVGISLSSWRSLALYLIVIAPLAADFLMGIYEKLPIETTRWAKCLMVLNCLVVAFAIYSVVTGRFYIWTSSAATFGPKLDRSEYALGAAEYLSSIQYTGRLFCEANDGGFLAFTLRDVQVPGDTYFSEAEQTRRLIMLTTNPEMIEAFDREVDFKAAVVPVGSALSAKFFFESKNWRLRFADDTRMVFLKEPSTAVNFNAFRFYSGQDLRRASYRQNLTQWIEFALLIRSSALVYKLVSDVQWATSIPKAFLSRVLIYVQETGDLELKARLLSLVPRATSSGSSEDAGFDSIFKAVYGN